MAANIRPFNAQAPAPVASQATAVEQQRAIAEVQAMVIVAQRTPRDLTRCLARMRESCQQIGLAEGAFFKFPRGGQQVAGPSIHLARELARCWGNITYGIQELDRDDVKHRSEMVAFAWDLETNTRSSTSFIVPHLRDKRGGAEVLLDMRDIYENNANMGARRLREMIFSVMPRWFTDDAEGVCMETLKNGGGDEPLPKRITAAIAAFEAMGIARDRIEAKLAIPLDKLTPTDLARLRVTYKSIERGEVTAEDEFPLIQAAAVQSMLTGGAGEAKPADTKTEPEAAAQPRDAQASEQGGGAAKNGAPDAQTGDEPPVPTISLPTDGGSVKVWSNLRMQFLEFVKRARSRAWLAQLEAANGPLLKVIKDDFPKSYDEVRKAIAERAAELAE